VAANAPTAATYPTDLTKANKFVVTASVTIAGQTYSTSVTLTVQNKEACAANPCAAGVQCLNCGLYAQFPRSSYGYFVRLQAGVVSSQFCPGNTAYYCQQGAVGSATYATPSASTGDESSGLTAASTVGAAVGAVAGCAVLLVVIVVIVVARRRSSHIEFDKDVEGQVSLNPTFVAPINKGALYSDASVNSEALAIGHANPMYEWYQPEMSRKDCTTYLLTQPEGAFVIRDSAATPGWHMLAVKNGDDVVHEKIRYTEDGQYELLPTETSKEQPKFASLPQLVEYYLSSQPDAPYQLAAPTVGADYARAAPAQGPGYLFVDPSNHAQA